MNKRVTYFLTFIFSLSFFSSPAQQPDSTLQLLQNQVRTAREKGDSVAVASAYENISEFLFSKSDFKGSIKALNNAVPAAKAAGAKTQLQNDYRNLSTLYDTLKDFKNAFYYNRLYSNLRDTLQSSVSLELIEKMQEAYKLKEDSNEMKMLEKENEFWQKAQDDHQELITAYFISGAIILLLLLVIFVGRSRVLKKEKNINITSEKENDAEIKSRNTAEDQYAQKLRQLLLTSDNKLTEQLPEHFIYTAKEIAAGNFYGVDVKGNKLYLSLTGNVNNGSAIFQNTLTAVFLEEAINNKQLESPEKILEEVNRQMMYSMNLLGIPEEEKMSAVVSMFDLKGMWLRFACSNNALWLIRNNELKIFDADKTLQTLGLRKGDLIYLFANGNVDPLLNKKLESGLLENHSKSMQEQKVIVQNIIEAGKGNPGRISEILVIGIRV